LFRIRPYRVASVAVSIVVGACVLPAVGQAALINFGSGLGSPASVAIAHPVDTAFWSTALSGGAKARSPQAGQVLTVRLRGCAKPGSGGQAPLTQIHFQVLSPGSGSSATIKLTSGPFNLPTCGGAVSGATISTFHPIGLCVARGDYVAFNDEGGFAPGGFPGGVGYEVFAPVAGAATSSFTGAGATNNGDRVSGRSRKGLELLMQLQLGTGRSSACG
jgi:hypothetical protein